ncbi:MAG: hypothetical protein HeimAB125_18140 [Candidatus Heimdallarchaeota archaeon AB_125]|nr:MAG: hypothetical protein HeimAB125_18140 [Candidatus Heimdallarchaeota archaeon AB_125]
MNAKKEIIAITTKTIPEIIQEIFRITGADFGSELKIAELKASLVALDLLFAVSEKLLLMLYLLKSSLQFSQKRLEQEFSILHLGQKKVCCFIASELDITVSASSKLSPQTLQYLSSDFVTDPQFLQDTNDITNTMIGFRNLSLLSNLCEKTNYIFYTESF